KQTMIEWCNRSRQSVALRRRQSICEPAIRTVLQMNGRGGIVPNSSVKVELSDEFEFDSYAGGSDRYNVWVEEYAGLRMMCFDDECVQSAMKVGRPHELALDYTRHMMAFLLF